MIKNLSVLTVLTIPLTLGLGVSQTLSQQAPSLTNSYKIAAAPADSSDKLTGKVVSVVGDVVTIETEDGKLVSLTRPRSERWQLGQLIGRSVTLNEDGRLVLVSMVASSSSSSSSATSASSASSSSSSSEVRRTTETREMAPPAPAAIPAPEPAAVPAPEPAPPAPERVIPQTW